MTRTAAAVQIAQARQTMNLCIAKARESARSGLSTTHARLEFRLVIWRALIEQERAKTLGWTPPPCFRTPAALTSSTRAARRTATGAQPCPHPQPTPTAKPPRRLLAARPGAVLT